MMEASGKKKTETDRFTDTVFSWSLEDILDENLYKNKVCSSTFTHKFLIF